MVTRAALVAATCAAICAAAGCGLHVNTKLDPTLHYHAPMAEMTAAPAQIATVTGRQARAQVIIEELSAYYPVPIGLQYSSAGASRKLRAAIGPSAINGATPELLLTEVLRSTITPGAGPLVVITGAVVGLQVYRLGDRVLARAVLELRVVRDGDETYTARYAARARTWGAGGLAEMWPDLQRQLVGLVHGDPGLWSALEAGS